MTDYAELVGRLQDESLAFQRTAWSRPDGGQDCSISAMLAEEAATAIERLTAREAELRAGLVSVIDAADSFCDCSGDEVAAQVRIRARLSLGDEK